MASKLFILWILLMLEGCSSEDSNSVLPPEDSHESDCLGTNRTVAAERCDTELTAVLGQMDTGVNISRDEETQTMCKAWKKTRNCYHGLMSSCNHGDDDTEEEVVYKYYQRALERMKIYSLSCGMKRFTDSSERSVVQCYLPSLGRAQKCIKSFDENFTDSVAEEKHVHACRLVGTLLLCYNEVKMNISSNCGSSAGKQFHEDKVAPFVQETHQYVGEHCKLPEEYQQLYGSGASNMGLLAGWTLFFVVAKMFFE